MKTAVFCFGTLALAVALNLLADIQQGEALAVAACFATIIWGILE